RGVGHEEAAWMGLEGECYQRRAERARMLAGALQQHLMAAMHAVEIAERHRAALPLGGGGLPVVEDRHRHAASRRGTSTGAPPSITPLSPFRRRVFGVPRPPLASVAGVGQAAGMVWPMMTGAMKFSDCET